MSFETLRTKDEITYVPVRNEDISVLIHQTANVQTNPTGAKPVVEGPGVQLGYRYDSGLHAGNPKPCHLSTHLMNVNISVD